MPLVDPQIGAFIFSSASVVLEDWAIGAPRELDIMGSAQEEQGASSQGKLAGRTVTLMVDITGTTPSNLQDNVSAFIAATSSDLPQDLHLEPQFPGRYLLVKRTGELVVRNVQGAPGTRVKATVEFFADDPYWLNGVSITQRATLSTISTNVTINLSGVGAANAKWIPLICVLQVAGTTFQAGKTIKITNTTTQPNEIFRYKANADLTGGSAKVGLIDGESKEVLWDGELQNKNVAGIFPRLRGGISNVIQVDLDSTGSNGLNSTLDFVYAERWS